MWATLACAARIPDPGQHRTKLRRARLDPGRRLKLAADVVVEWGTFH